MTRFIPKNLIGETTALGGFPGFLSTLTQKSAGATATSPKTSKAASRVDTSPLWNQQPKSAPQSANPNAPIVQFRGVTKSYTQGNSCLQNVNLQVKRGDFLFITGPSGSGKSTLLKLIYGEERPDRGEIVVDGLPVHQLKGNRLALLRRRLGVVFQDYKLITRRTIAENVAFVLRAQGIPRKEIQRRLASALAIVDLQDKADAFPHQLSGGEQQRASIARAIVGSPTMLLADEPTGNLDAENAFQVLKILTKLNTFGITVMVTTHDTKLFQATQFPVIHLCNGRLQATQPTQR
jgi:cell division transport system ATP-binding protein